MPILKGLFCVGVNGDGFSGAVCVSGDECHEWGEQCFPVGYSIRCVDQSTLNALEVAEGCGVTARQGL